MSLSVLLEKSIFNDKLICRHDNLKLSVQRTFYRKYLQSPYQEVVKSVNLQINYNMKTATKISRRLSNSVGVVLI